MGISTKSLRALNGFFWKTSLDMGKLAEFLCLPQTPIGRGYLGGYKNLKSRELWQRDTVVPIFSTTKAVASLCLAMLHSKRFVWIWRSRLQLLEGILRKWKTYITIAQLFGHRAGLSAINTKLTKEIIDNPVLLDELLAEPKPYWPVNEYQGYHVWTIGWYLSALISRIDTKHRRLGIFWRRYYPR